MSPRHLGFSACLLALVLLGLSLVGGTGALGQGRAPVVSDAWVRLPAAAGRPAAGYMVITGGAEPDALVSARSLAASRIEVHTMAMDSGVMRMRMVPEIAVPAGTRVEFRPGGNHLMLFGLDERLKPGDRVPVTLGFRSGVSITIEAQIRPASG